MTRVLIAESVDEKVLAEFQGKLEFVYSPDITPQELETKIRDFDGLIVRPKPVSAKVIANAKRLKLIIRGGAGVNSIDLTACREKGIIVENTPGLNSDATAEFTVLLMLQAFAKRQVELANIRSREGNSGQPEDYMGRELKGKKLGIIGFGNIGKRVARIAEGFGMELIIHSRKTVLKDLLNSGCDIILLHIPLSAETTGLIGEKEFALMKNGTVIINTARPQLIDVRAFKAALESGKISSFGIDGDYDLVKPFIDADVEKKGIITHHIADSTYEAQANITRAALTQAVEFFMNGKEINHVI